MSQYELGHHSWCLEQKTGNSNNWTLKIFQLDFFFSSFQVSFPVWRTLFSLTVIFTTNKQTVYSSRPDLFRSKEEIHYNFAWQIWRIFCLSLLFRGPVSLTEKSDFFSVRCWYNSLILLEFKYIVYLFTELDATNSLTSWHWE